MKISAEYFDGNAPLKQFGNRWYFCRPLQYFTFDRFRQAWDVLTGKADALYWEQQ